jgi:hypothetical protein
MTPSDFGFLSIKEPAPNYTDVLGFHKSPVMKMDLDEQSTRPLWVIRYRGFLSAAAFDVRCAVNDDRILAARSWSRWATRRLMYRNRRGRCFGGPSGIVASGHDQIYPAADHVGSQFRKALVPIVRIFVVDGDIAAFVVTHFVEAAAESGDLESRCVRRRVLEKPYHGLRWLLPACDKRPRRCPSADKRNEISPPHG